MREQTLNFAWCTSAAATADVGTVESMDIAFQLSIDCRLNATYATHQ